MFKSAMAALLVTSVLTACSSGDGSGQGARKVASPSSTSWPPVSVLDVPEPRIPDVAFGPIGEKAARGFIRYVVELASFVSRTGFSGDLDKYSLPDCWLCNKVIGEAARLNALRYLNKGGTWSIVRLEPHPGRIPMPEYSDHIFRYALRFRTPSVHQVAEGGEVRASVPALTFRSLIEVDRIGTTKWFVRDWVIVAPRDQPAPV
jgi:hypothetical protein